MTGFDMFGDEFSYTVFRAALQKLAKLKKKSTARQYFVNVTHSALTRRQFLFPRNNFRSFDAATDSAQREHLCRMGLPCSMEVKSTNEHVAVCTDRDAS
jgi:hypothetical protein